MAEPLTQTILEKPMHGTAALRRLRAVLPEEMRGRIRSARELGQELRDAAGEGAFATAVPVLDRQVRIEGTVERTSREESEVYFISRPLGSRLGAWASPQSRLIAGRGELARRLREVEERFGEEVPLPESWGGYRVRPETIEFWQGRPSRLHDRLLYSLLPAGGWKIERLAP